MNAPPVLVAHGRHRLDTPALQPRRRAGAGKQLGGTHRGHKVGAEGDPGADVSKRFDNDRRDATLDDRLAQPRTGAAIRAVSPPFPVSVLHAPSVPCCGAPYLARSAVTIWRSPRTARPAPSLATARRHTRRHTSVWTPRGRGLLAARRPAATPVQPQLRPRLAPTGWESRASASARQRFSWCKTWWSAASRCAAASCGVGHGVGGRHTSLAASLAALSVPLACPPH
jgi:hypothetical protein